MDVDDAYENLVIRMNPPRVTIDNSSCRNATLVKVESANRHRSLLEVVQALTVFNLRINRAYISSDGEWFMDVFHVTDQDGNKVMDGALINRIEQSLKSWPCVTSLRRSNGVQAAAKHTSIELTGRDRPGLLSEVFAVLSDLKCNVSAAEVWTHNSRMASIVHVTDELSTGSPINDPGRLSTIQELLRNVLSGDRDKRRATTAVSNAVAHVDRRLHQLMYADRDYEGNYNGSDQEEETNERGRPCVTVEDFLDRGYSVINLRCRNRPKVLFDTVCTLTDMQYVVFHATVIAEGSEAFQEYYIRHLDGCTVSSEAERQRLIRCLEAAVRRRSAEGLRLELCGQDRLEFLSDVTRIFRENGLAVTGAEITTQGSQAVNVFYVTDASGNTVRSQTIDAVRQQLIGQAAQVKDGTDQCKFQSEGSAKFSLRDVFRSSAEKFLYYLGLMKWYS